MEDQRGQNAVKAYIAPYNISHRPVSSVMPPDDDCEGTHIANGTNINDIFEIPAVRYALVACYIVAIILSAAGNGYLMYYILRHRRRTKRNVTALLIFNLAFCDFIITVFTPLRLFDILMPKVTGKADIYCKVGSFFSLFLACIAFLSIIAIASERLLLICYPLKAKSWLTIRNTRWLIFGTWVLSFTTAVPLPILYTFIITIPLSNKIFTFCLINVFPESCSSADGRVYFLFLFILYYLIPVVIITVCYSKIFHTLYCGSSLMKDTTDERQLKMINTRRSLAKMMLFIAVSFALLEGPYFFTFLFLSIGYKIKENGVFLLMIIEFLPMISAIINPFVYSVRTKTFKKSVGNASTAGQGDSLMRRSMNRSNSTDQTHQRQSHLGRPLSSSLHTTRGNHHHGNELEPLNNPQPAQINVHHVTLNGVHNEEPTGTEV